MCDILARFRSFFGQRGGDQVPGNTGPARQLVHLCRDALATSDPVLFDYYTDWDTRGGTTPTPLTVAQSLMLSGQWEAAWDVGQLHFDQTQKKEAQDSQRRHKGHPLCGLSILGQVVGSNALVRHYARLSSVGDVYWTHQDPSLQHGGLGSTILEAYESIENHDRWRDTVRGRLGAIPTNEPRYLEAFLLMRWFGAAYWDLFISHSVITGRPGQPFADVLLDLVETPGTGQAGKLFEAAAALLFSSTPGFEVRSARRTTDEQIDLVVQYERDRLTILPLPEGPGLVECKSSDDPVRASELRDFGSKCLFHRVKFGILVARANITRGRSIFANDQFAELARRRFLMDGVTILVIDIDNLRWRARHLRGLQEPLAADHDRLTFGPVDGDAV
jgi:hypothetical protein